MMKDPQLKHGKIVVESLDGELYAGETFSEVVDQMRLSAWGGDQCDGVRGYMKQVAKRIWDWSQKRIRIATPEMFVRDMKEACLIRLMEKDK